METKERKEKRVRKEDKTERWWRNNEKGEKWREGSRG